MHFSDEITHNDQCINAADSSHEPLVASSNSNKSICENNLTIQFQQQFQHQQELFQQQFQNLREQLLKQHEQQQQQLQRKFQQFQEQFQQFQRSEQIQTVRGCENEFDLKQKQKIQMDSTLNEMSVSDLEKIFFDLFNVPVYYSGNWCKNTLVRGIQFQRARIKKIQPQGK